MKKIAILLALALIAAPAVAGTQQEKMKNCSTEAKAKALKGEERKAFMSKCLSATATPAAPAAEAKKGTPTDKMGQSGKMKQTDKMKKCNADAKDLKGDERKKFMSACLKG